MYLPLEGAPEFDSDRRALYLAPEERSHFLRVRVPRGEVGTVDGVDHLRALRSRPRFNNLRVPVQGATDSRLGRGVVRVERVDYVANVPGNLTQLARVLALNTARTWWWRFGFAWAWHALLDRRESRFLARCVILGAGHHVQAWHD